VSSRRYRVAGALVSAEYQGFRHQTDKDRDDLSFVDVIARRDARAASRVTTPTNTESLQRIERSSFDNRS